MSDHPIIFSDQMVRAILNKGHPKTQTRRVIKPQPQGWDPQIETDGVTWTWCIAGDQDYSERIRCPYRIGQKLWVRETWCDVLSDAHYTGNPDDHGGANEPCCGYRSTMTYRCGKTIPDIPRKWRPSIFMPRWAARLTPEIVGVRAERVQDISDEDIVKEGVYRYTFACGAASDNPPDHRWAFIKLWDSINAKRGHGWHVNDWVWVVEFGMLP